MHFCGSDNLIIWGGGLHVQYLLSDYGWLTHPNCLVCAHQGLFKILRLHSHSNCLQAFSSLYHSNGNELSKFRAAPSHRKWGAGSLHTSPDTSWEELRGHRGGALISPFLRLSPSLYKSLWSTLLACEVFTLISVGLSWFAEDWIHLLYLYLCRLLCLRFLITDLS